MIRYRNALYRKADMRVSPDMVGQRVRDPYLPGGPAQPYLYHVTAGRHLAEIALHGLLPGTGGNWEAPQTKQHSQGRVFFSTQPDKWLPSYQHPDRVLLRVPTEAIACFYDGGEWLYDGSEPEDEIIDGRQADCYCTKPVSIRLVDYVQGIPDILVDVDDLDWKPVMGFGKNPNKTP